MAGFTQSLKGVWFILKTLPVFILRQTPFRNSDLILTGLSPEGYLTIHARGALKMTYPFQAMVSLGAWSELTLNQTRLKAYLEKANLLKFPPLPDRENLVGSLVMQVLLQILLLDEEADHASLLYDHLVQVRQHMQTALSSYLKFLFLYLEIQGLPVIVDYCVHCQTKVKIVGVNPKLGGFICQNCLSKVSGIPLSIEALKLMRAIKTLKYGEEINLTILKKIIPLVHQHFNFHLDVQLEGFKTIEKLMQ